MNRPLYSICHTTARTPDGWLPSYRHWMAKRSRNLRPDDVEYILSVDRGEEQAVQKVIDKHDLDIILAVNAGPRTAVAGWNRAAEMARGTILLCNADDCFAPQDWDTLLLNRILATDKTEKDEFVIHVSTGSPWDKEMMAFSFISAARYNRLGYVFWPEYKGMVADNDFTAQAYKDGVVIDAQDLMFEHHHPFFKTAQMDPVYEQQNAQDRYDYGNRIFQRRKQEGFPNEWKPIPTPIEAKQRIAICMPGAVFSARWVMNFLGLIGDLETVGFEIVPPYNAYSSDPSVTRDCLREGVLRANPKPDFVLWMDDDNPINSAEVRKLLLDLDTFPELAAVFAWCWIQVDGYTGIPPRASCGRVGKDGLGTPFTPQELLDNSKAGNLMTVGYSGFPAVVMRYDLLEKVGDAPFAPIVGAQHAHGRTGEDFAFCQRAREKGFKLAVDPQVKIPHLKLGSYEPDLSQFISSEPKKEDTERQKEDMERQDDSEPVASAAD